MASSAFKLQDHEVLPTELNTQRFVARQPILDLRARVHGYELLFRNGVDAEYEGDGNLATRIMLDNAVLFGLDKFTGGMRAFVNCTSESLVCGLVRVLPTSMTVLEVLETTEPTPELIAACRRLKGAGFRLALDDFIWKPELLPLVEMADYIKVDIAVTGEADRRILLDRLHRFPAKLVAEKVETQEEFRRCRDEGFHLFQGFYFCHPEVIPNSKVPANRISQIEILNMIRQENLDLRKLGWLVKRETSLTYRILRLINSPLCAVRQEVRSVEMALLALGQETFRRIAILAITCEMSLGQPSEVLRLAFLRGRFCEMAALYKGLDTTEQYLLGMLSMLPAMVRLPMDKLVPTLPLRAEIRAALLGEANAERCLLDWVECYEHGAWERCDAIVTEHELDANLLLAWHEQAVEWADSALSALG